MTKKVIAGSLALLAVTAMYAQTYQLPNVGFEDWEKAGKSWLTGYADTPTEQRPYTEPTDWNSSNVKCTAISFDLVKQQTLNGSKYYAQAINTKVGSAISKYVPYVGALTLARLGMQYFGTGPEQPQTPMPEEKETHTLRTALMEESLSTADLTHWLATSQSLQETTTRRPIQ